MVYFFWGIFKSQIIFSLYIGQMGDFTMTEKTDYKTWKGKLRVKIGPCWVHVSDHPGIRSENRLGAQLRGEGWNSDSWIIDIYVVMYALRVNGVIQEEWTKWRWKVLEKKPQQASQSISRGKRHSKEGGEEATFRRLLGQQTNALLKKPKAKNNKEEKCFSNVRGEGWRLELPLPCLFP